MATKRQIAKLKHIESKIQSLQGQLSITLQGAALLVEEITGISGECDWLPGDGIGFTCSDGNVPVFMPFGDLIKLIEIGEITKDEIDSLASL